MNARPATTRQIDFLRTLDTQYCEMNTELHVINDDQTAAAAVEGMMEIIEESYEKLTVKTASARIDRMKTISIPNLKARLAEAKKTRSVATDAKPAAAKAEVTEGMYKMGEQIYKVQRAVHGSGNLYAKVLTRPEDAFDSTDWKFEYAPGAVRRLRPEHKLTLEEAKAFGALYGTCCCCGRTLTNEDSIAEGIGPICAGKL